MHKHILPFSPEKFQVVSFSKLGLIFKQSRYCVIVPVLLESPVISEVSDLGELAFTRTFPIPVVFGDSL